MRIVLAIFDVKNNIIMLCSELGEKYVFDVNDGKELPLWASEEFKELEYITRLDDFAYFLRVFDKK